MKERKATCEEIRLVGRGGKRRNVEVRERKYRRRVKREGRLKRKDTHIHRHQIHTNRLRYECVG